MRQTAGSLADGDVSLPARRPSHSTQAHAEETVPSCLPVVAQTVDTDTWVWSNASIRSITLQMEA